MLVPLARSLFAFGPGFELYALFGSCEREKKDSKGTNQASGSRYLGPSFYSASV
jgi:hypothetical protein